MRLIWIDLWCQKIEDAIEKLHRARVESARFRKPMGSGIWGLQVQVSELGWPVGQDKSQLLINVGWILGIIGAPKETIVDFDNVDEEEAAR